MRITWVVPSLGYNNNLLYWGAILDSFMDSYPQTRVLTATTEASIDGSGRRVEKLSPALQFSRKLKNGFTADYVFPMPSVLWGIRRTQPEVLIASEFGLMTLYAMAYRLLARKSRLVLLVESDPGYSQFDRRGRLVDRYRRLVASLADVVLTNNRLGREYLVDRLGVPSEKVVERVYLTSAIPAPPAHVSGRAEAEPLRLIYVGQLITRKGIDLLLHALEKLPAALRAQVRLDVVGDGAERETLEAKRVAAGLEEQVTFHGRRPYEELGELLTRADVLVLPTLADYRALVGFEALSCGLAIIGSVHDGASPETVEEGVNGFVVDPVDTDALSDRIGWMVNNRAAVVQFQAASRERAQRFTPAVAAKNLVDACALCVDGAQGVDASVAS